MLQSKPNVHHVVLSVMLVVMLGGTGSLVRADNHDAPRVIPVDRTVHGNTYGEWSARWAQWLESIPAATNPALDSTGEHCAEGQAGPVWFLGSTLGQGPVTRNCKVPAGKPLFFPLIVVIAGAGAFDCEPTNPGVACNLATLRSIAAELIEPVTLEASLDGKPLRRLLNQRVQSPVFTFTEPEDNITGIPAGTYAPNVADGSWVMLAPLGVGPIRSIAEPRSPAASSPAS